MEVRDYERPWRRRISGGDATSTAINTPQKKGSNSTTITSGDSLSVSRQGSTVPTFDTNDCLRKRRVVKTQAQVITTRITNHFNRSDMARFIQNSRGLRPYKATAVPSRLRALSQLTNNSKKMPLASIKPQVKRRKVSIETPKPPETIKPSPKMPPPALDKTVVAKSSVESTLKDCKKEASEAFVTDCKDSNSPRMVDSSTTTEESHKHYCSVAENAAGQQETRKDSETQTLDIQCNEVYFEVAPATESFKALAPAEKSLRGAEVNLEAKQSSINSLDSLPMSEMFPRITKIDSDGIVLHASLLVVVPDYKTPQAVLQQPRMDENVASRTLDMLGEDFPCDELPENESSMTILLEDFTVTDNDTQSITKGYEILEESGSDRSETPTLSNKPTTIPQIQAIDPEGNVLHQAINALTHYKPASAYRQRIMPSSITFDLNISNSAEHPAKNGQHKSLWQRLFKRESGNRQKGKKSSQKHPKKRKSGKSQLDSIRRPPSNLEKIFEAAETQAPKLTESKSNQTDFGPKSSEKSKSASLKLFHSEIGFESHKSSEEHSVKFPSVKRSRSPSPKVISVELSNASLTNAENNLLYCVKMSRSFSIENAPIETSQNTLSEVFHEEIQVHNSRKNSLITNGAGERQVIAKNIRDSLWKKELKMVNLSIRPTRVNIINPPANYLDTTDDDDPFVSEHLSSLYTTKDSLDICTWTDKPYASRISSSKSTLKNGDPKKHLNANYNTSKNMTSKDSLEMYALGTFESSERQCTSKKEFRFSLKAAKNMSMNEKHSKGDLPNQPVQQTVKQKPWKGQQDPAVFTEVVKQLSQQFKQLKKQRVNILDVSGEPSPDGTESTGEPTDEDISNATTSSADLGRFSRMASNSRRKDSNVFPKVKVFVTSPECQVYSPRSESRDNSTVTESETPQLKATPVSHAAFSPQPSDDANSGGEVYCVMPTLKEDFTDSNGKSTPIIKLLTPPQVGDEASVPQRILVMNASDSGKSTPLVYQLIEEQSSKGLFERKKSAVSEESSQSEEDASAGAPDAHPSRCANLSRNGDTRPNEMALTSQEGLKLRVSSLERTALSIVDCGRPAALITPKTSGESTNHIGSAFINTNQRKASLAPPKFDGLRTEVEVVDCEEEPGVFKKQQQQQRIQRVVEIEKTPDSLMSYMDVSKVTEPKKQIPNGAMSPIAKKSKATATQEVAISVSESAFNTKMNQKKEKLLERQSGSPKREAMVAKVVEGYEVIQSESLKTRPSSISGGDFEEIRDEPWMRKAVSEAITTQAKTSSLGVKRRSTNQEDPTPRTLEPSENNYTTEMVEQYGSLMIVTKRAKDKIVEQEEFKQCETVNETGKCQNVKLASVSTAPSSDFQGLNVEVKADPSWVCQDMEVRAVRCSNEYASRTDDNATPLSVVIKGNRVDKPPRKSGGDKRECRTPSRFDEIISNKEESAVQPTQTSYLQFSIAEKPFNATGKRVKNEVHFQPSQSPFPVKLAPKATEKKQPRIKAHPDVPQVIFVPGSEPPTDVLRRIHSEEDHSNGWCVMPLPVYRSQTALYATYAQQFPHSKP